MYLTNSSHYGNIAVTTAYTKKIMFCRNIQNDYGSIVFECNNCPIQPSIRFKGLYYSPLKIDSGLAGPIKHQLRGPYSDHRIFQCLPFQFPTHILTSLSPYLTSPSLTTIPTCHSLLKQAALGLKLFLTLRTDHLSS